jgi:uncharacterized membrane protein
MNPITSVFNDKHHMAIAAVVGILAGFWAANAPTTTGIYSTFIGQTAANIYMAGNKLGGNKAPAAVAS